MVLLGWLMLLTVFLGLFGMMVASMGWLGGCLGFLAALLGTGWIYLASGLAVGEIGSTGSPD